MNFERKDISWFLQIRKRFTTFHFEKGFTIFFLLENGLISWTNITTDKPINTFGISVAEMNSGNLYKIDRI